jgi:16S rRNA (uracil1498-N3)-methyltransferase
MRRVFIDEADLRNKPVVVTNEKAHYLFSVLRCRPGDLLIATDEKARSYTARILTISKKEVNLEITGEYSAGTESGLKITLVQGLLKGEKMDLVIQKTTELGVDIIIPVITERSQIRDTRKLPRWKKIAAEASRQSGRSVIPEIPGHFAFTEVFDTDMVSGQGIIFWEREKEGLANVIREFRQRDRIVLFIGPEGGFSEAEILLASERGFVTASLGSRILRAETASIAAVSIIQYTLGDLGSLPEAPDHLPQN